MTDDSVFSPEETAELARTQGIRTRLIDGLAAAGVPPATSDKVLLLGLLDGSDRSTLTRAKMRHDKKQAENNASIIQMVSETLRSMDTRSYRPAALNGQREIPVELSKREFVPGELGIGNEPIQIEQLIEKS